MAAALRTRLSLGYGLDHAVCVYDLAEKLGVEVRFLDLPSMEGMYSSASIPSIIVSSLRPAGRRTFTCAHELGHHNRNDGLEIDELVEQWDKPTFDSKEFAADCFAGTLLMPKMAVSKAFAVRGWTLGECTPEQIFVIAGYFGVGYATLVHHLRSALQILPTARAQTLLNVSPREAQSRLLGRQSPDTILVVDNYWTGRAIDLEVGGFVLVEGEAESDGSCIEPCDDVGQGRLFQAARPGIGRLVTGTAWSAFVRVSRSDYVGRALYRHWEEAAND